jgi:hypothetical protein
MIRSIIGVIVGIFCGGIVVLLLELPGMFLHPPPPGIELLNSDALRAHINSTPTALKIMVIVAWAVGPFVGALIASWIAGRVRRVHSISIGIVFTVLVLLNLISLPHPIWMWMGLVAPLPMARLGANLAERLLGPQIPSPKPYDMREKNMAC